MSYYENLLITKEDAKNYFNFDIEKEFEQKNAEWLKPYNAMSSFCLYDYVFLLKCETRQTGLTDNIPLIRALISNINNGDLPNSKINYIDFYNGDFDISIDRIEGEQWAIHNGYKWHLPAYKPFKTTVSNNQNIQEQQSTEEVTQLQKQIEELQAEKERLIIKLAKYESNQSVVNYENFSIYGYSSENIMALFKVIEIFYKEIDPTDKTTVPRKEDITEFLCPRLVDSKRKAEAIDLIARAEWIRKLGAR